MLSRSSPTFPADDGVNLELGVFSRLSMQWAPSVYKMRSPNAHSRLAILA